LIMTVFRLYLAMVVLSSQVALAATLATPEWSFDSGGGVSQLAPFPDSEHAEGVLLTGGGGIIRLVAPGGRVLSRMQMDEPASAYAIPVIFRRGEEPRIVAADDEGSIYCFRRTGERDWKYTRVGGKASDFRLVTAADVEGNGTNQILMSDYRGHLYAVDAHGHLRFEVTATNFRVSPAAAGDIDGDGRAEVIFGTDDKDLYAVSADGDVLWHTHVDSAIGRVLPTLTSLSSGERVVLVATPFVGGFQGLDAVDAKTGKTLWHARSLLQSYQSNAVADIDGDGTPEILFGDKSNRIFCLDAQGKPRWNVHLDGRGIFFAPAIADLEGRGRTVIFQVTRAESVNGKNIYAVDANGTVIDSWALPGGGAGSPILCRWGNERALHLLVAGGSGKLISYALAQSPGARILWNGLQGSFAPPPRSPAGDSASPVKAPTATDAETVSVSLGTTLIHVLAQGAKLIALRVADPDGVIHLTLLKSYSGEDVAGELLAPTPGNYDVTTQWFGDSSQPLRTGHTTYRAGVALDLPMLQGSGELAAYLKARISAARQLALSSGSVKDYDAAHAEADYDQALMAAVDRLAPRDPVMAQVVHNPWSQHTPTTLLAEQKSARDGVRVEMLGNEYASAAVALTNVTARPLTVVLRATLPQAVEFRDVPMVVPDTTDKPQEDPLPLLGRGQTVRMAPAETHEIWLTFNSRSLDAGQHDAAVHISVLERIAPSIEIPLELTVSRIRLPDRFSYMHCNWLYLAGISDAHLLDATLRDAVEHRTNVFNIPGPNVRVNCDGTIASAEAAVDDRLIPRLPGAFFLVDGYLTPTWPAGCSPDQATQDAGYSHALHWFGDHMHALGVTYEDYALYLQDEPGLNGGDARVEQYVKAVKRVKAADPEMQVYTNPAGGAWPDVIKPLAGVTDVWCPDLHLFRLDPAGMTAVFSKAKQFWHYEAPGDQRGLDPLGFYRMKPWIAFQLGMNGGGYWVYSSKDYWIPSHDSEYGVVYPGPRGPVTTKRWEASREGSQDFELLTMLRRAAQRSTSPEAESAQALIDEAVAFVTRGQEHATDISRHFHTYAPDFDSWMSYRAKLIAAAEELIP
jgi:outer membrane protein assembly factor BamB